MIESEEMLVLVDQNDQETGQMEKIKTHQLGLLHRAFSIFIFNSKGELLLQKRSMGKYHSSGLWSNTCCSHPRVGELIGDAAERRLQEEMGMSVSLEPIYSFIYNEVIDNGMTEHEYDHVFIGMSDDVPKPDATEVSSFRYISVENLKAELAQHPLQFSIWLRICMEAVSKKIVEPNLFKSLKG